MQSINSQSPSTQALLDTKLYQVVGQLYELGFNTDRFDRITDHTKQIAMVPVSAKTREGIPELLMIICGLAQRFLTGKLEMHEDDPAKGTVLEVKEEKGLGKVMDIIIYDGVLRAGDEIVVGGLDGPLVGKIKGMFAPAPLADMRDKKSKFVSVKEAVASTGVRVSAPGLEDAVAGMPLRGVAGDLEKVKEDIQKEISEVMLETDEEGVVIKADSLGSLEALMRLLKDAGIPVKKAGVGPVNKTDIAAAESMQAGDPFHAVILGFNIPVPEKPSVKVLTNAVIYRLIEDYQAWVEGEKINKKKSERDKLPFPAKITLMKGYVFRQNNPAVCGVEVQLGTLKPGIKMMKQDGVAITTVKGIQLEQENVEQAEKNKQVAVSFTDITIGRQVQEGDILYTYIEEPQFRALKEVKDQLTNDEKDVLREISLIMRVKNPVWGV
jgi:translation initiation factor 5B